MIQRIISLGDKRLKQKSTRIKSFSSSLVTLVDDMIETMYAAQGIGLAAVQIGILKRIFVIDIAEITDGPLVFINPSITERSKDLMSYEEGCLSIANVRHTIQRPKSIIIEYQDIEQKQQKLVAEDLLAICIQHEYDHLEGIFFIDYIKNKKEQKIIEAKLRENNLDPYFI